MGRNDNIKRAKKLKEAKRKREQEVMIDSGQGPAQSEMKKRVTSQGAEVRLNTNPVKYSNLLKEYAEPMLQDDDSVSDLKTKFFFGIQMWNAAVMKERNEEVYLKLRHEIMSVIKDIPEGEKVFDDLMKRKQDKFAEYKNFIVDFEIKKIRGMDFELSVATSSFYKK